MAESVIINVDEDDSYSPVEGDESPVVEVTDSDRPPSSGPETAGDDDEVEIEVEGRKPAVVTEDDRLARLEKENRELQDALIKLSSRSQEPPQATTVAPVKEDKLTKGQLAAILNENRDPDGNIRPDILMNIVEHLVEERTNDAKSKAFMEFDQANWNRSVASATKSFMAGVNLGPQEKAQAMEFVRNLKLEDNPAAEMIGYALLQLGQQEQAKQSGVKESPAKKTAVASMDKTRVSGSVKSGSKKPQLTEDQIQIAKKFGVSLDTYAKFVGR